jgi:hypothetical protein
MVKKIKSLLAALAISLGLALPFAVPVIVHAQNVGPNDIPSSLSCGSQFDVKSTGCAVSDPGAEDRVNTIIKFAINIFSVIVGIVAVVMIIVGGLRYITSGGEASNVSTAKNTIVYAIVGLVIVALAQIIVRFVLSKVGNNG